MSTPRPTPRSVADIKSNLLRPALTSHFEVTIPIPKGLIGNPKYMTANGLDQFANLNQSTLNLLCCEASLPGSNIGTMDITNDYHGVTVRHANRRIYDDRIDLTFYVDAQNYLPIKYFETWMKYIVGESITQEGSRPGSKSPNYFYRLNYPDLYIAKGLTVTKFERTGRGSDNSTYTGTYTGNSLTYEFINAFPISIASMPVSYEASSLLKCTVSLSYIRYVLGNVTGEPPHPDSSESTSQFGDPSSPVNQAMLNDPQFFASTNTLPGLEGTGALSINGISQSAANSSGNSITYSDISSALSAEASLITNQ